MENIITMATLATTNSIIIIILFNFFSIRYKPKYKNNYFLLLIAGATISMVLVNMLNNSTLNLIAYISVFISLNTLVFEIKSFKDVFINVSFFLVVFLLLDTLCFILVELVLGNTNSFLITNSKMIIASFMQFTTYNILKNFIQRKKIDRLSLKDLLSYAFISIFSLLVTYLFTFFSKDVNYNIKVLFFVVAIGLLISNICYIKILESLSQKSEMEESIKLMNITTSMLYEHYSSLEQKEEQTRLILHDIKNHLQVLNKSVEAHNDFDEYLLEVKANIDKLTSKIIINRRILNILFLDKMELASKYDIKINFDVDMIDTSFITDYDIITIFSNILDNAIDALSEVETDKRELDVIIKKTNDSLLICAMNACKNKLNTNRGKIVTNKNGHTGLGLKCIERVVKKYSGNMVVEIDEHSIFSITILIPM